MDNIAAVDMGLTARRDDHREDELANRMTRTRANDPVRRSGPPPPVRNPIEPDDGRRGHGGGGGEEDDSRDRPNGRGGGGIRAPNTQHPPHLQAMAVSTQALPQAPRRRPSQIRPEVDARERDAPPAAQARATSSPSTQRAARTSISSTTSRESRASTTDATDGGTDVVADSLGALLMQEEAEEGEADLPCYPDAEEDARRIATELDAGAERAPDAPHPDPNVNNGRTSPPAYPAELLPFINDMDEKRPPPS
ncbi:hypothetical protein SCHPADRAFT_412546 [Schizopora paradoxa]|uniref:Uncharacterized protein n=1 Tax=Schizopora paradoxa TaxID=27342 RepID=A0A0H2S6V2_9AGAM|nr:hypothetical protein SCHPADRAFT_412546 [Schizopora paradoxa]